MSPGRVRVGSAAREGVIWAASRSPLSESKRKVFMIEASGEENRFGLISDKAKKSPTLVLRAKFIFMQKVTST